MDKNTQEDFNSCFRIYLPSLHTWGADCLASAQTLLCTHSCTFILCLSNQTIPHQRLYIPVKLTCAVQCSLSSHSFCTCTWRTSSLSSFLWFLGSGHLLSPSSPWPNCSSHFNTWLSHVETSPSTLGTVL